jgi:hypothetical protein
LSMMDPPQKWVAPRALIIIVCLLWFLQGSFTDPIDLKDTCACLHYLTGLFASQGGSLNWTSSVIFAICKVANACTTVSNSFVQVYHHVPAFLRTKYALHVVAIKGVWELMHNFEILYFVIIQLLMHLKIIMSSPYNWRFWGVHTGVLKISLPEPEI